MSARHRQPSHEGYISSSPSIDAHSTDPFAPAAQQQRYYDNESDNAEMGRRDTFASDSSNAAITDPNYDERNANYEYYREHPLCTFVSLPHSLVSSLTAPQDTDSDGDAYGPRYPPSAESLGPPGIGRIGNSESSTPTFVDLGGPAGAREPYPAWTTDRQIPLSKEEIEDVFLDLTQKFGFQRDSMRNMVIFFTDLRCQVI